MFETVRVVTAVLNELAIDPATESRGLALSSTATSAYESIASLWGGGDYSAAIGLLDEHDF